MEAMGENESKSLADLKSAVKENFSITKIGRILDGVPVHERLHACAICQESSDREIREAAINLANNLRPEIIHDNLSLLLDCQGSQNQHVRDFANSKFDLFSSRQLASNLVLLVEKLTARFTLIRFYAEELLMKIEGDDLTLKFKLLSDFYVTGRSDVRRVSETMLIRTIRSLPPALMCDNFDTIIELQKSENTEIKNLADWMYLKVMKNYWYLKKISDNLAFIIECRNSESDAVKELAAYLFLAVISNWSIYRMADELDYLVTLQRFADKEIRRRSRDYVLTILETYKLGTEKRLEKLYEKRNFLIRCQESKFYSVRHRANKLLAQIPITSFSNKEDILALIEWYLTGYRFVGKTVKRILFKIPAENYLSVLDDLLKAQRSIDPSYRYLNESLALRIPRKDLITRAEDIQVLCTSGYSNVAILARELNFLIS